MVNRQNWNNGVNRDSDDKDLKIIKTGNIKMIADKDGRAENVDNRRNDDD